MHCRPGVVGEGTAEEEADLNETIRKEVLKHAWI